MLPPYSQMPVLEWFDDVKADTTLTFTLRKCSWIAPQLQQQSYAVLLDATFQPMPSHMYSGGIQDGALYFDVKFSGLAAGDYYVAIVIPLHVCLYGVHVVAPAPNPTPPPPGNAGEAEVLDEGIAWHFASVSENAWTFEDALVRARSNPDCVAARRFVIACDDGIDHEYAAVSPSEAMDAGETAESILAHYIFSGGFWRREPDDWK